uniref:Thymosin beta n=1 Tax=Strigamia maritima TaxID=126957 RepID=T1JCD5_STRMM
MVRVTLEPTIMSCPTKELPKVPVDMKNELTNFDVKKMKHTEVQEKINLPSMQDVAQEKAQTAVIKGVEEFSKESLKHSETREENILPDKDVIKQEKEINDRSSKLKEGIAGFNPSQLKPTETQEKNTLPTVEVIEQEKKVGA